MAPEAGLVQVCKCDARHDKAQLGCVRGVLRRLDYLRRPRRGCHLQHHVAIVSQEVKSHVLPYTPLSAYQYCSSTSGTLLRGGDTQKTQGQQQVLLMTTRASSTLTWRDWGLYVAPMVLSAAAKSPGALPVLSLPYGAAKFTVWIAAETCSQHQVN